MLKAFTGNPRIIGVTVILHIPVMYRNKFQCPAEIQCLYLIGYGEKRKKQKGCHSPDGDLHSVPPRRAPHYLSLRESILHIQASAAFFHSPLKHTKGLPLNLQKDSLGICHIQHCLLFLSQSAELFGLRHFGNIIESVDIRPPDRIIPLSISLLKVRADPNIAVGIVKDRLI